MPGIVLVYNKKSSNFDLSNAVNNIATRLYNCNEFQSKDTYLEKKVFLKLMCRSNDFYGISQSDEGWIAWYGRPMYKGKLFDGEMFNGIKDSLGKNGINKILDDVSGHFQLVVYLKENNQCYVVCDKTSTHPFYYVETSEFAAFSPEPLSFKGLSKYGWTPSIRRGSIFEYMASGYLWGDECFYEGLKRIGPGQYVSLDKNSIKLSSYWKMIFASNRKTEKYLITELYEAIQKDICDLPKGNRVLTLSGGYDSRALLGFLRDGDKQVNTVSYSYGSKANKRMDVDVGEYYAGKAGASHSCYRSNIDDASRLMADIDNAVLATGGENYLSVFQDAFLGTAFYEDLSRNYDYMIRGDEVWGWGDLAVNYDMAFWESRLFNLNEIQHPRDILKSEVLEGGIKYITDQRHKFVEESGEIGVSANDLKDYLYWRHREARLLQSMAYFRRCYIPHFAPFLFDRTLEVIKRTPSKYRVQKSLFMNMGREMFPDLFLDQKVISPHSSDINNFSGLFKDAQFRSFVKGALLESSSNTFSSVFDRKTFELWIDGILDDAGADISYIRQQHNLKRVAIGVIEKSRNLKGQMKAYMVKKGLNTFPVLSANYLFRLVVLSLGLQKYESE